MTGNPRGDWDRLSIIFSAALDIPLSEREAFLEKECSGQPELRKEVESMLRAEAQSIGFLEPDVHGPPQVPKDLPGGWHVLEKIGEGGMGAIYRARREADGFTQIAAVKMLPVAHLTPELGRRLRAERRILSALQHPYITRLLDGGSTSGGVPFLVMELVEDGLPVPEYCQARRLSIRERLELFLKVCEAVEYAHQQLVVHRDIKPSNILITPDGQPKLLDFGIAKLLEEDSVDGEGTRTMYRALSVNYASPEQLRGLPVTTSTDVYSLGTLLTEILCGERRDLTSIATPERAAEYLEREPPLKPGSIRKDIPRDVDAIVEMATRAEPHSRYSSVAHLAADIRRHLDGLPVLARNGTFRYRAAKFVNRNKLVLAVAATTVTGLIAFAWAFIRAENQRYRAEQQLSETRAIAGMMAMYIPGRITEFPGSLPLRRRMVNYGVAYLDQQTAERDPTDARKRLLLGMGYFNVANSLGGPNVSNLGMFAEAARCYRIAVTLLMEDDVALRRERDVLSTISLSLVRRPETLLRLRRPQEALQAAEECIQLSGQIREDTAGRAELTCRATRLRALADLGQAVQDSEVEAILQRESEVEGARGSAFAKTSNKLLAARLYLQKQDHQKALQFAIEGLDITARNDRTSALSVQRGRLLMIAARAESALGTPERAAGRFEECFDILRELVRKEPEDVESRGELARSLLESVGFVEEPQIRQARLNEAEALVRGILKDTTYPAAHFLFVRILAAQADLRQDCGLRAQALQEFAKLESAGESLPGDRPIVDAIRAKSCDAAPVKP
jgi:tetratricopeptide (TPR) repeat protein